jgi:TonB dependent receptor
MSPARHSFGRSSGAGPRVCSLRAIQGSSSANAHESPVATTRLSGSGASSHSATRSGADRHCVGRWDRQGLAGRGGARRHRDGDPDGYQRGVDRHDKCERSVVFPTLRIGTYTVTAELKGFRRTRAPDVELNVQDRVEINLALEVGQVTEAVQVKGQMPLLQFADNLTWTRSTHTFKFGVERRRDLVGYIDLQSLNGSITFNDGRYSGAGYGDFLLGLASGQGLTLFHEVDLFSDGWQFYAQDSWRLTSDVTLDYGLRYEYFTPSQARDHALTTIDPATGEILTARDSGSIYDKTLIHPDRNNWAPRVGVSYSLSPSLMLRAGYGIFYQQHDRYGSESQLALNPPQLRSGPTRRCSNQEPRRRGATSAGICSARCAFRLASRVRIAHAVHGVLPLTLGARPPLLPGRV